MSTDQQSPQLAPQGPPNDDGFPQRRPSRPPRPKLTFRPSALLTWLIVTILLVGPLEVAVAGQSGSAYFSAGALGGLAVLGALALVELRRARAMAGAGVMVERVEIGLLRGRVISVGTIDTPDALRRVSWSGPRVFGAVALALGALGGLLMLASAPAFRLLSAAALLTAAGVAALGAGELIPTLGSPGSQLVFARAWRRTGQRDVAVVAAARAAVASGWLLLAAGAASVFFLSFAGIWLMLIGGLTIGGARLTLAGARARQQLAGLRATDVMSPAPPEVSAFATVEDAFTGTALPNRADVLLVRESDGSFGGAVTTLALAAVPGDDRAETRVRTLAIAPDALAIVTASEPMDHVLELMAAHPTSGIAIVLEDETPTGPRPHSAVAGLVTTADVARALELSRAAARTTSPLRKRF